MEYTDEVDTWTLYGQVQEYFHSYSDDPVAVLAAMTKWITENIGPDRLLIKVRLDHEYATELDDYVYVGIVEWA